MITRKIVQAQIAGQYDGSNGQEFVDLVMPIISVWGWSVEVLSEANGEVTFRFDNGITVQNQTLSTGDWMQVDPIPGGMVPVRFEPSGNSGMVAFLPEETP